MKDNFSLRGDLRIVVKDTLTGEIKYDKVEKNLVVTAGKTFIASRMAGTTAAVMGWMEVGTDNTAADVAQTALIAPVAASRVALSVSGGTPSANTVTYVGVFPAGTGTGALVEAGIFNANSAGTMLSRSVFTVVNKGAPDEMTISWTITVG